MLLSLLVATPVAADKMDTVVVTIKPLAMLVKAVAGEHQRVEVLLPGSVSPHDYALKLSDVRYVKNAALVIWVGPELETALGKVLSGEAPERVMSLAALDGMHWPSSGEAEPEESHGHHEHVHERDPHLWLNPQNGLFAARAIAARLSELFPQRKAEIMGNLRDFTRSLNDFDRQALKRLAPLQDQGFVVTHDGYGHFVQHYQLRQLASVQLAGGRHRGARHYAELMALGEQVACVLTEVQLNNKGAEQLADKLGAKTRRLDTMGQQIVLGQSSYLAFMGRVVDTFAECLTADPE